MPDTEATQGLAGSQATQGSDAGKNGAGAPKDAPPAEEMFPQSRVNAIAAKEARKAEAAARKAFLDSLEVADEQELQSLVASARAARPKEKPQDDATRITEKLKAQFDAEKAELAAKLQAIETERNVAKIRDTAKSILENAGLVKGGAELVLAKLGLADTPDHRLELKNGKVIVVDADGDPAGKDVDKFLLSLVPEYLTEGVTSAESGAKRPAIVPKPKDAVEQPKPRKLSRQEELDGLVGVGLASVQGKGR